MGSFSRCGRQRTIHHAESAASFAEREKDEEEMLSTLPKIMSCISGWGLLRHHQKVSFVSKSLFQVASNAMAAAAAAAWEYELFVFVAGGTSSWSSSSSAVFTMGTSRRDSKSEGVETSTKESTTTSIPSSISTTNPAHPPRKYFHIACAVIDRREKWI